MKLESWRFVVVTFLLLIIAGAVAASDLPQLIRLRVADRAERERVGKIINLDEQTRGQDVYGWAWPKELEALRRQGFVFETVAEERDAEALTMCSDPDGPPFEPPASWNCYPTYSQYVDLMNYYATNFSSICRLVDFGGTFDGDHRLLALVISDNVAIEEDEPEFLYTSSMHGDETAGYSLTLRLAHELLTLYGSDPEITGLVDDLEIWINPLANPDGTFAGGDSNVSGSQRYLTSGIDANRNFPDPEAGDDPLSGSWATEIQAMIDLAENQNFVMSANFHGGAEVVNYPWDLWTGGAPDFQPHPDDIWYRLVSKQYADHAQGNSPTGYLTSVDSSGYTNGGDWYVIDGGRQDFMNYYYGCREVTLELSDQKTLDSNELEAHWGYNRQALLDYMKQALNGIRGLVTDDISGAPVAATVKVVGHDDETFRTFAYADPDNGNYHRPIEEGSWQLQFSAEGYETKIVSDIDAVDGASTRRDVEMTALMAYSISGSVSDRESGLPIAGADAELIDTALGAVETDSNGEFLISGVWEGAHTLFVSAPGYGPKEDQIVVNASATVFDVELAPIQTVFNQQFEMDDGGFLATDGWQWGTDTDTGAVPASKVWGTVIGGDYGVDDADWSLDSPEIFLSADLESAHLEFAHWFEFEGGYDGGQVQISVDGGTFDLVVPEGGYPDSSVSGLGTNQPGYTGNSSNWVSANIDLAAFIGHSIVVRWRFGSDYSQYDYRGWYIDDVRVVTTGGIAPGVFSDGFESGDTSGWDGAF